MIVKLGHSKYIMHGTDEQNDKGSILESVWGKYAIFFITACLTLFSCSSAEDIFFMRYKSADPEKLREDINNQFSSLKQTKDDYEEFVQTIDLSETLTIAGREREAIELLQRYVKDKKIIAKDEDLVWLYLNYATANQYNRKERMAEMFFKKALMLAQEKGMEHAEHYVLHHYGRFLVEKRKYELAKEYFNNALSLRRKFNDERTVSTEKALAALDSLTRGINPSK
jgi:tetratricopeptide (TPR) repeat protein